MSAPELRSAGLTDPPLVEAYSAAGAFLRRHNSAAYPVARVLLPPARRPYWDAMLAFSTYVDDLIDDSTAPVEQRLARFDEYVRNFDTLLAGTDPWSEKTPPRHEELGRQLAYAFAHVVHTWDLPHRSVRRFLSTIRTDLNVTEYPDFAALDDYIRGVCGEGTSWGNALLVDDCRDRAEADEKATAASFGLQLTDYLRDLGEDLSDGRLYLPLEDLKNFDLTRSDIEDAVQRRQMTQPLRELVRFEVTRARRYFAEAADWPRLAHPSARELPRQYVRLGELTLRQIAESDYDVFHIAPWARIRCSAMSTVSFAGGYVRARFLGDRAGAPHRMPAAPLNHSR